jgi:type I restriction enzyme S subunit
MLLDIRPDHLQIVRNILQRHVPQYTVWAFGSRAKWTAKDYSDLDLCIISDKALDFRVLGALEEDFSESDLPYKVDVVDWAMTSESFRKIIEQDKVVIQEGEQAQTGGMGAVGRVSPTGVTRQGADATTDAIVGLRFANPTYATKWRQLTFGDFLAIQRGHDLPDQSRRSGNIPILGSFGITGFHDTVKAKGAGVTIGRSGASFGVAAYTDKDYWPLNTALYVTD